LKHRIAIISKNPIPYHSPLYRELASSDVCLEVLHLDSMGVEPITDEEFKISVVWDVSLLDGYNYSFLKNYSWNEYGGFFSRLNPGLFSKIKNSKYDAILLQGYDNFSCWLALFTAKLFNLKVIWRGEATLKSNENDSSWKGKLKKIILKQFFGACDAVMFSCTGNKEYLLHYGVADSKMFPIPCAVDNNYFRKERKHYLGKESSIKAGLGISENNLVILFAARFTTRKRPLDLLAAVNSIDHENITILFLGDGVEKKRMEQYVTDHDIKAVFLGFKNQSEIARYYSISDVAVVISDYDPSPKAMNEAMNFELPIIVSDVVGTARDLVKNGDNGFIVSVGDIEAIARHLNKFNFNRCLAKEMGEKSLKTINKWTFSEDARWVKKALDFSTR